MGFSPYDRDGLVKDEEESRRMRLLGLEARRGKGGGRDEDVRNLRREWQSLDDAAFVAAVSGRLPLLIQVRTVPVLGFPGFGV